MMDLFKRHMKAFEASDWDAYKADLAPSFEYEEIATGRRGKGDEFIALLKGWKTAFPDLKTEVKNYYEAGDVIFAEVEWTGTHKGSLDTGFGSLPASNKTVRERGALIFKIKDGKFIESRSYFDVLGLMKQIGAGAAFGAPAAKPEAEKRVAH
jgi:steroid delta-isomerase-like uncharacterized protein